MLTVLTAPTYLSRQFFSRLLLFGMQPELYPKAPYTQPETVSHLKRAYT